MRRRTDTSVRELEPSVATVPVSALATPLNFLSCKQGGTTALSVFFLQLLAALKPSYPHWSLPVTRRVPALQP